MINNTEIRPTDPAFPTQEKCTRRDKGMPVRLHIASMVAAQLARYILEDEQSVREVTKDSEYWSYDTETANNHDASDVISAEKVANISLKVSDALIRRHNETATKNEQRHHSKS